ncbi:hypothetical protein [uncultured Selenomonas sp.]|uniref:hypothetical protein n=1 Tax=uncultured Selenomonas sp. TaxID=159275 RepID=UPI002804B685|nr:hypothetical protein [uncultured Selenomonas sp.]
MKKPKSAGLLGEAAASVGEKLIPEGVGYHQEDEQQEEEITHRESPLSLANRHLRDNDEFSSIILCKSPRAQAAGAAGIVFLDFRKRGEDFPLTIEK